jgi:hypothetical protein
MKDCCAALLTCWLTHVFAVLLIKQNTSRVVFLFYSGTLCECPYEYLIAVRF